MEAENNGLNIINLKLNRSQALIKLVNANVSYQLWPRASGKTHAIGDRIEHLSEVMPRSQVLLYSDSYKRIEERIVPNILSYFINDAGMVEDEDFVVFKKPPAQFKKPLIPIKDYSHVVSFSNGLCLCCASQMVSGSANAFNAQALIVDEAKYVEEEKINTEVLPALRGAKKLFGHLPEYRSHWYFTDKYGENIKWLLAKKKMMNPELIKAVITEQLEILRLENKVSQYSSTSTQYQYLHTIYQKKERLDKIRRELIFYSEAIPFENIDHLGEKYFRDLKRDLSEFEYEISILNKDPDRVQNSYYPELSSHKHYYHVQDDTDPMQPLIVAMDYQWRITPMVVAQYGTLPGYPYTTFNIVNALHTLHPVGGIEQTVRLFCDQYRGRIDKIVVFVYDHTATGKRPDGKSFKDLAMATWISEGWNVIEVMIPQPEHNIKFEQMKNVMRRQGDGSIRFNEPRCEYLLKSVQQAGAIQSSGKTKKDKKDEKNLAVPAEETTDYSDAFDQVVWAGPVMNLVTQYNSSFVGDIVAR